VEVAEDVLAAMELISSFEPDLVVLDLGLPGSAPGLGVLEIVRTHHPGMRMVLLGERSNGAPAVPKPVDPDALLREVSQALATAPVA
jgi:DNA-binding response OmpR family regulator